MTTYFMDFTNQHIPFLWFSTQIYYARQNNGHSSSDLNCTFITTYSSELWGVEIAQIIGIYIPNLGIQITHIKIPCLIII